MHSKHKLADMLGRITFCLLVLTGGLVLLAMGELNSTSIGAKTQEQGRFVARKPWHIEPVQVVSAKTKKKGKIEIGKAFDEDDDWLDGFTITVSNGSDKTVTALTIEMTFPREAGDKRNKFAKAIYFGPSPIDPEYIHRNPNKVIKPGETIDLEVGPQIYNSIRDTLRRLEYPNSINRVELTIREVGFEDGSVLLSGTLYVQDPNNPGDPTKKIPADKAKTPPDRRNHRIGTVRGRESATRKKLFLETAFGSSNHAQDSEDCWAQRYNTASYCDPNLLEHNTDCRVIPNYLSQNTPGDYSFELNEVTCYRYDADGERVDCYAVKTSADM